MAEHQTVTTADDSTAHFIQFVMMHQQQTLLALGRHPNPPPGAPPSNLNLAKAFIDQLGAIRERTAGNLSPDEATVLQRSLGTLQQLYVEAVRPQ